MRRSSKRAIVTTLCLVGAGGSAIPSMRQPPRPDVAPALEDAMELEAGEVLVESIELDGDSYFEFEFEQLEGDLAVEWLGPDGGVVAASDLAGKPWLRELLSGVTATGGVYSLRRVAVDGAVRFREISRKLRPAAATDHRRATALSLRRQALELRELDTEDDLRRAADLLEQAVATLPDDGSSRWVARLLREAGRCRQRIGEVARAESHYRESVERLRGADLPAELAESLDALGELRLVRGQREAAREAFEEALALAQSVGDRRIEALTRNNLGGYHYYQGEMEQVVAAFERSLEIGVRAGRLEGRANTLANLGAAYRALGRYGDALRLSTEALELARRQGDTGQEMRVLNNRGVLLKGIGDLRSAAEHYRAGLELARRLGDARWQANIGSNLGALYRLMGHRRRALELLDEALEAATAAESATDEVRSLLAIGEILRELGDAEAESVFARARERCVETGDRVGEGYSLYGLGRLRRENGEPEAAKRQLEKALSLLGEATDRPGQLSVHRELGRALADLGEEAPARDHLEEAVALARLVGDPYQEAVSRAQFARFLLDVDDPDAAQEEVRSALATVESLRRGVVEHDLRAGLLSRSHGDFALLVDILESLDRRYPRAGYDRQAFAVAERSRARSLVEMLTEAEAGLEVDVPAALESRRRELAGRLSAAQRAFTHALRQAEIDRSEVGRLKGEVVTLHHEREDLEREIRLGDPRWSRLRYPDPLDLEQAQRLLEPGQLFVSFVLGERSSLVLALCATDFALERIAAEGELRPRLEEFRRYLERPGRRSIGRLRVAGAELYRELLAPVERLLIGSSHLLISPDGPLHYLPFEALTVAGVEGEDYLLSRWAVSYLPSATTLGALQERGARTTPRIELAAFGDPLLPAAAPGSAVEAAAGPLLRGREGSDRWRWRRLAGARAEVAAIAELFDPEAVEIYLGEEASEGRFRTAPEVLEARYLHIASHAVIDSTEPALSALLLTAGPEDGDGLLQPHEIFDLDMQAELVVLSGCETALGRQVRGEGLLGMTRAFLYAGADAVAVSLWPVEDSSTSALMVAFYEQLTTGAGTAEALRRAKLAQLEGGAQVHPYYWAPFVVVGSPR